MLEHTGNRDELIFCDQWRVAVNGYRFFDIVRHAFGVFGETTERVSPTESGDGPRLHADLTTLNGSPGDFLTAKVGLVSDIRARNILIMFDSPAGAIFFEVYHENKASYLGNIRVTFLAL
jgi:hypothetical protein